LSSALLCPSLVASSFSFFFYALRVHRDLHSFPTRRSSDLERRGVAPRVVRHRAAAVGVDHVERALHQVAERVRELRPVARVEALDRKSTRLNSSHDQISYAVFCLKKKSPETDASVVMRSNY